MSAGDDEKFKLAEQGVQHANTDGAERTLAAAQVNATLSVAYQIYYLREEVSRVAEALEALQGNTAVAERSAQATELLASQVEGIKFHLQRG